jgi:hypothetical protein
VSDAGLGRTTPDRRGGDLKLPACRSPLRSRAYSSDSGSSRVRRPADTPPKQPSDDGAKELCAASGGRCRDSRARGSCTPPVTSRQVPARAMSAGRSGAEPPLSLSRCRRRARSTARGSIRPRTPYIGRTHLDVTGSEGLVASVIAYFRAARAPAKRTVAFAWA